MSGGIGVVMNPRAGGNARHPGSMARLGLLIRGNGEARPASDLEDLYRLAEQFKRDRISVLGINGGDGTNHVVLTAFIKTYGDEPLPSIAFLRGGTMNTTANACGVKRGSPGSLLSRLIDKIDGRLPLETVERDVLDVDGNYGFLFGTGLMRNYLQEYYDDSDGKPSPITAVRTLVWGSISSLVKNEKGRRLTARCKAKVTCDGQVWPTDDYLAIAAGTIDQIGLGFRPFPRAGERAGRF
ncbi:MAG: sphingosine kinase, partial [Deltaproteobacteria bacterium]|nr:sphingosine kinase [Deltaproteobacteria bacterium]